jgi:hypothetical protein
MDIVEISRVVEETGKALQSELQTEDAMLYDFGGGSILIPDPEEKTYLEALVFAVWNGKDSSYSECSIPYSISKEKLIEAVEYTFKSFRSMYEKTQETQQ